MFNWDDVLKKTLVLDYKNHKYQIIVSRVWESYRIDLIEDGYPVCLENTNNKSFKNEVNDDARIENQIFEWGNWILKSQVSICDKCKEEKLVKVLENYDIEKPEFNGLKAICKKCRDFIYRKIGTALDAEMEKGKAKLRKKYMSSPPIIVGGYDNKVDAYKYLCAIENKRIENIGDGFISAKAILTAKDGTHYPVFSVIDRSSGGELWESQFIAENYETNISQDLIIPYIRKDKNQIFPYTYETLSFIEEDFHQKSWLGYISQLNVKHHYANQVEAISQKKVTYLDDAEHTSVRTYFSFQHILSAALLLKEIKECELSLNKGFSDDVFIKYRAFCVNAIISIVSFMEASINELFMDASDNRNGAIKDLSDHDVETLAGMWKLNIPRTASYSIIEKYQIALNLLKKECYDLGCEPAQSVSILIKLRNSLIHYEPEWVTTQSIDEAKLKQQKMEKYLRDKFEPNEFTGENNPFFPDKCFSIGLVKWAFNSVLNFTDTFYLNLGLIPPYEKIKSKLEIIMDGL